MTSDFAEIPAVIRRKAQHADYSNNYPKYNDVTKPQHYASGRIECIEAIHAATENLNGYEGALVANIFKYLWRYKRKGNPVQDLQKAQQYLQWLVAYVSEQEGRENV